MSNLNTKEQTKEDKERIKATIERLKKESQRYKGNPAFAENRYNERKEQNAQK